MLAQAELSKVAQCLILSNYFAYVQKLRESKILFLGKEI